MNAISSSYSFRPTPLMALESLERIGISKKSSSAGNARQSITRA